MDHNEKWLQWAVKLQSIAQAGLFYGKDEFDKERYEQIRNIAAEMISYKTDIPRIRSKICSAAKRDIRHPRLIPERQFLRMGKFCW